MSEEIELTQSEVTKRPVGRPRTRPVEEKKKRRRRGDLTIGRNQKLSLDTSKLDSSYVYRWVNDTPGRVQSLTQQDDWDVVTSEEIDERDKGSGTGVERIVSATDGMRAVLVRKPKEYYDEDKGKEQDSIREMERAMERGSAKDSSGSAAPSVENVYTPAGGGISISSD